MERPWEAPYRGYIEMSSVQPRGIDGDAYMRKDGVMVVMSVDREVGRLILVVSGECRDMTDHRNDGKTVGHSITDELNS